MLIGLAEQVVYQRTHCRLCETPSTTFIRRPDEPDLLDGEFGYPLVAVPLFDERFGRSEGTT